MKRELLNKRLTEEGLINVFNYFNGRPRIWSR